MYLTHSALTQLESVLFCEYSYIPNSRLQQPLDPEMEDLMHTRILKIVSEIIYFLVSRRYRKQLD
uniref:Uncharacterized protein n=1 Tax=Schistosoma haematobium TaxID=6185 RepID=A0A094ZSE0_SCHHA